MNELLQKHGCSNVFSIPDGLRELMSDISREVLREQPVKICDFIANYLSALLITREHGLMAVKILDDLCDCRPSVSEHLIKLGMPGSEARALSEIIREEIESVQMVEGKEIIREAEILKRILKRNPLDEETSAKVCLIARNAYRDYWYRKKMLEQNLKVQPDEPWEIAAQHTLEIYKLTKPSFSDLTRATQKIQAAYRGYHVRRQMLGHLKPKKKQAPKVDLLGPPIDIAESREIDLGPVVDIQEKVFTDDMSRRFVDDDNRDFGLGYDTMKTITHVEPPGQDPLQDRDRAASRMMSTKSMHTELFGADTSVKQFASATAAGLSESVTQPKSQILTKAVSQPQQSAIMAKSATQQQSAMQAGMQSGTFPEGVAEARLSYQGELPAPPEEEIHKISFGPSKMIESDIPEDIPGSTVVSEGATPTFDLDLSSTSKTASVPDSAATTAPTSDVEDLATSGPDEGEEE